MYITTFQSQKFIQINKVPYEVRIWEYNNQEDISMNCVNRVNNVTTFQSQKFIQIKFLMR